MNIDRHNYEEFFILYLDNELSADERRKVEEFAAAHPDLKEELDLLLQSKLVPDEEIVFSGKEELLKHAEGIGSHNYTEWLLLYTDNELNPAQKSSLEQWIAENPSVQDELELLQNTKLQPDENIVFPHKHLLYRKEERRVVAIRWWRMAVAAALLLAVSTTAFMFSRKHENAIAAAGNGSTTEKSVAEVRGTTTKDSHSTLTPDGSNSNTAGVNSTEIGSPVITDITSGKKDDSKRTTQQEQHSSFTPNVATATTSDNTEPLTESDYIFKKREDMTGMLSNAQPVEMEDLHADPALTIHKQITPLPGVTQEETQPLDIINQSGKKNKLRGFFRKITRTFEKTTNIKATDGDDRLLVGGLAIKF